MNRLLAMQVFSAVVEAGSFARAADQLRMSTTAVSRYVAELEHHLGARLLQRSTRHLSLTETGAHYYDRCRHILADIEDADAMASNADIEPRGVLRISLPLSFGHRYVAPSLPGFCARYPRLHVDVSFADRFVDLVEEGIDVAIRISRELPTSVVARRLAPVRMVVCAAPEYLERRGRPTIPDDLRQHACLTYDYAADGGQWRFVQDGRELVVPVKGPFRSNSGDMLLHATLAGQGIALQPTFIVGDELRSGRLVPLLEDFPLPSLQAHAMSAGGGRRTGKVKAFVDYFVDIFGDEEPVWDRGLRLTPVTA